MLLLRAAAAAALLVAAGAGAAPAEELVVDGLVLELAPPGSEAPPRAAAGLALELELRGAEGRTLRELRTGDDGRFELVLEDPGDRPLTFVLRAPASASHRAASARATLAAGERAFVPFRLERAAHGALEGEVVDGGGRALAGARVVLVEEGGDPQPLATSDADGRFRVAPFRGGWLRAELEGHAAQEELEPEPLDAGGWRPLELALSPAAALELRVVAHDGAPVAGLECELFPLDEDAPPFARWQGPRAFLRTDEEGRARFEPAWAEVPLELAVWGEGGQSWALAREHAGELVRASHPDGRAIVLEPGERCSLELRLGAPLVVRGQVRALTGRAYVHARELDPPAELLSPTSRTRERVGDDGRFELRLLAQEGLGRLFVCATRGLAPERRQLAFAVVDPREARDGALELELVAAVELELRGRVLGVGRHAPDYSIRAVPAGLSRVQAQALLAELPETQPAADGSFALRALGWGRHDLIVQERTGCIGSATARFGPFPAGGGEHALALEGLDAVRLRVRALPPEGELSRLVVLAGRVFPTVVAAPPLGEPSTRHHVAEPRSWPPEVPPSPGRITTVEGPEGIVVYRGFETAGASLELPRTAAGWYVLGVLAKDERGRAYAPVVTPPLGLGPGLHEVTIPLTPTTELRVHVLGAGGEELHVELRDPRGRRVTLRRSLASFAHRLRIRRDGELHLREVPLGPHRLWIGAEDELDSGRYRAERLVELGDEGVEVWFDLRGE